jgi:hypothetical protein
MNCSDHGLREHAYLAVNALRRLTRHVQCLCNPSHMWLNPLLIVFLELSEPTADKASLPMKHFKCFSSVPKSGCPDFKST